MAVFQHAHRPAERPAGHQLAARAWPASAGACRHRRGYGPLRRPLGCDRPRVYRLDPAAARGARGRPSAGPADREILLTSHHHRWCLRGGASTDQEGEILTIRAGSSRAHPGGPTVGGTRGSPGAERVGRDRSRAHTAGHRPHPYGVARVHGGARRAGGAGDGRPAPRTQRRLTGRGRAEEGS